MQHNEPLQNTVKVVVIGAGPGGLAQVASLINDAKNTPNIHYQIEVIEKRSSADFKRRQRLVIHPVHPEDDTRWDEFCQDLFDPAHELKLDAEGELLDGTKKRLLSLNKRQKFIRKLLRQPETKDEQILKNFSIKDLENALLEHINDNKLWPTNISIIFHSGTTIYQINLESKTIKAFDETKQDFLINFDILILSEGVKREVTELINKEIEKSQMLVPTFKFLPFSFDVPPYHCAVRLTLTNDFIQKFDPDVELCQLNKKVLSNKLQQLGWKETLPPIHVIDCNYAMHFYTSYSLEGGYHLYHFFNTQQNDSKPTIFVASEIPSSIYNLTDKSEQKKIVITLTKILASIAYNFPEESFAVDTKGEDDLHQRNVSIFESQLMYVDNPIRTLQNGARIVMMGDCAISPFYTAGISATNTLNQAITVSRCITQDNFLPLIKVFRLHKNNLKRIIRDYGNAPELDEKPSSLTVELTKAIQQNAIDIVEKLLIQGADPNDSLDLPPLFLAIKTGNPKILQLLIDYGAYIESKFEQQSPFLFALKEAANISILDILFNEGANLDKAVKYFLEKESKDEIAQLKHKADINKISYQSINSNNNNSTDCLLSEDEWDSYLSLLEKCEEVDESEQFEIEENSDNHSSTRIDEIERNFSKNKNIKKLFTNLINEASLKNAYGFFGLAKCLSKYELGKLNLFHALVWIDRGNTLLNTTITTSTESIKDLTILREKLKVQLKSNNACVALSAKLDLIFTEEYERIKYNISLPEAQATINFLKKLSIEINEYDLKNIKELNFLNKIYLILKKALQELSKVIAPNLYTQLQELKDSIRNTMYNDILSTYNNEKLIKKPKI